MEYIAILTALNIEFKSVLKSLNLKADKVHGYKLARGQFHNNNIVLLKTGCGIVKAAIATNFLISNYTVKNIINIGFAGAITSSIITGDVIIVSKIFSERNEVCFTSHSLGKIIGKKLVNESIDFVRGKLISVRKAVLNTKQRDTVNTKNNACAVDMEAFSISKICSNTAIPFISIKIISDDCEFSFFKLATIIRNLPTVTKKMRLVINSIMEMEF